MSRSSMRIAKPDLVEPAIADPIHSKDARLPGTGELGSEGGSAAEMTQAARARRREAATSSAPRGSSALTLSLIAVAIVAFLLLLWFGHAFAQFLGSR